MSESGGDEPAETSRLDDTRSLIGCLPGEPSLTEVLHAERRADLEKEEGRIAEFSARQDGDGELGQLRRSGDRPKQC